MSFIDNRHPQWEEMHDRWIFAWDNYTGEYASHDRVNLVRISRDDKRGKRYDDEYLYRKVQAETREAYAERILTSDPVLLFPTAVDSLNGILFANSEETQREWGALGDPEEAGTIANRLVHNADGDGTNWSPVMKQMGIKQTVLHKVWALVDGIPENEQGEAVGEASIKLINPQSIVNWWPSNGMPEQVLVKEDKDMRTSIRDEGGSEKETYILYTLEGWERYVNGENGPELIDADEYDFFATQDRRQRILPIFPVEIPMPRDIGYLLAIKQNHIYNKKSIRDFSVRNMSFAFLKLVAEKDQYDQVIEEIKKGFRVIRQDPNASGGHEYISPPSDYLTEAGDILEKDKTNFMESAFRSYGDAAKQVTATEIRQESRSGVEAFLTLLVTSLDEFENKVFWLMEQIYFPDQPGQWGQAMVERSDNFKPEDVNEALQQISTAIQRASGAMSLKRKVELLNPGFTEDEVKAEVQQIRKENGALPTPEDQIGG